MSLRDPASAVLFFDAKQQAEYVTECDAARAAQPTRFAVAPRCQVATPDGRILTAGQPITQVDLLGDATPAWRLLERHVHAGRVLENIKVSERPVVAGRDASKVALAESVENHTSGVAAKVTR